MIFVEVASRPDARLVPRKKDGKPKKIKPTMERFANKLPALMMDYDVHPGIRAVGQGSIGTDYRELRLAIRPSEIRLTLMVSTQRPDDVQVERSRDRLRRLLKDFLRAEGFHPPDIVTVNTLYGIKPI